MFEKLVAIEPVNLVPEAREKLRSYAKQVVEYPDIPADNAEIIRRIGDADAVLLSYTSRIDREVFEHCPAIRYVGMCCSLYSPESANVAIRWAEAHGIGYLPLEELLRRSEVVFACLNKNEILLRREQFDALGSGKILFNTSIGPAFVPAELEQWLDGGENRFVCDTRGALGDDRLLSNPKVICADASAGRTKQSFRLLSEKVLANIEDYLCVK